MGLSCSLLQTSADKANLNFLQSASMPFLSYALKETYHRMLNEGLICIKADIQNPDVNHCIVPTSFKRHRFKVRGDVKIQVAAPATVCSRLQKVAILLFQFRPI